jgi:hypothetical protein
MVHYVGDAVALVAATSEEIAKKAGSKDDFLFRRRRTFSKFTYFSFWSLHQVMITSFFRGGSPLFGLVPPRLTSYR